MESGEGTVRPNGAQKTGVKPAGRPGIAHRSSSSSSALPFPVQKGRGGAREGGEQAKTSTQHKKKRKRITRTQSGRAKRTSQQKTSDALPGCSAAHSCVLAATAKNTPLLLKKRPLLWFLSCFQVSESRAPSTVSRNKHGHGVSLEMLKTKLFL